MRKRRSDGATERRREVAAGFAVARSGLAPRLRPLARGFAVLALLLLLSGCPASTTYGPLIVSVRDQQTKQRVPGAVVHARPVHFYNVSSPSFEFIQPSQPRAEVATTGDDGRVLMNVIMDHPVEMIVVAPGREPAVVDLQHPERSGDSGWIDPSPRIAEQMGMRRLEVRFSRASGDSD